MQKSEGNIAAQSPPEQRVVQIKRCPAREKDKDDQTAEGRDPGPQSRSQESQSQQAGLREEGEGEKETGPVTERWISEESECSSQGR